jgi:hypothetical protein
MAAASSDVTADPASHPCTGRPGLRCRGAGASGAHRIPLSIYRAPSSYTHRLLYFVPLSPEMTYTQGEHPWRLVGHSFGFVAGAATLVSCHPVLGRWPFNVDGVTSVQSLGTVGSDGGRIGASHGRRGTHSTGCVGEPGQRAPTHGEGGLCSRRPVDWHLSGGWRRVRHRRGGGHDIHRRCLQLRIRCPAFQRGRHRTGWFA